MSKAQVQQPAPAFKATAVIDGFFEEISLNDFKGKWLIIFFFPACFSFVCPTEILAFNDALDSFAALNAEVLAFTTDSAHCCLAYSNTKRVEGGIGPDLKLKLVSDKNMRISRDYGVLVADLGIALRGLFIIDPLGIMRQMTINDMQVGRSVSETLRLLQAYQFADEHGEVCGADWSASEPVGIKADVHTRPGVALSTSTSHDASPAKIVSEVASKRDSEDQGSPNGSLVKKPKLS